VSNVTKLTNSIPQPPEVTSDMLGFKGMAMAATAVIGGFVVLKLMSGRKMPKSFKVVPE
jgi:NAD/NADP transhydrogenase alpha subunit